MAKGQYTMVCSRDHIRVIDYELMQLRWWQGLSWDESDNLLCFNNYIIKLINTRWGREGGEVGSGPSNVVMRCLSNLCKSQQNFWHTSSVHSQLVGLGGPIVWLLWVASNYQHDIKYIKITLDTRGRRGGEERERAMAGHMPHVEVKVFATCVQKTRAWSQYSRPNHIKSHARLHMNWYTIYRVYHRWYRDDWLFDFSLNV